jgi:hypothetical protein
MIGPSLSLLIHPVLWYDTVSAPSFIGPLDGLPVTTAAYSMRRLLSAYVANKAINVRRASDSAAIDVGFLANGDLDVPTLTTFLAATAGFITTWYDQSGGGFDMANGTAANQPPIVLSEATMANRPTASFVTANANSLSRALTPVVAQPFTMASVVERTGLFTTQQNYFTGVDQICTLFFLASANNIAAFFGTQRSSPANDSVAHCWAALTGVNKTALDGVITTTAGLGAGTIGGIRVGMGNASNRWLTGFIGEALLFPSALSDADMGTLQANQKTYWGTP